MFILALFCFALAGKLRSARRRPIFAAWRAEIHNHRRSTLYLILNWLWLILVVMSRRSLPSVTTSASNSSSFLPDGTLLVLLLGVEHLGFVDVFRHKGGLLVPHKSCHWVTTLHHLVSLASSLNLSSCWSISIRHWYVRFSRVWSPQSSRLLLLEGETVLLLDSVSICGLGSLLSFALKTAIQVTIAVFVNLPESLVEVVFGMTSHISVDLGLERICRLESFGDVAAVVIIGGVNLVFIPPPTRVHIRVQRARSGPILRLCVRVVNLVPRGRAIFLGAFRRIFRSILAPRRGSTSYNDNLFGTLWLWRWFCGFFRFCGTLNNGFLNAHSVILFERVLGLGSLPFCATFFQGTLGRWLLVNIISTWWFVFVRSVFVIFWRASSFSALLTARSSKGAFWGFLVSAMSSLTFGTGLDAWKLSCFV